MSFDSQYIEFSKRSNRFHIPLMVILLAKALALAKFHRMKKKQELSIALNAIQCVALSKRRIGCAKEEYSWISEINIVKCSEWNEEKKKYGIFGIMERQRHRNYASDILWFFFFRCWKCVHFTVSCRNGKARRIDWFHLFPLEMAGYSR